MQSKGQGDWMSASNVVKNTAAAAVLAVAISMAFAAMAYADEPAGKASNPTLSPASRPPTSPGAMQPHLLRRPRIRA